MQLKSLFIPLLIGFSVESLSKTFTEQPAWDDNLNFKEIEEMLKNEPIVSAKSMKQHLIEEGKRFFFFNEVYLVTLKNGLKAVFKPNVRDYNAYGEIAAYKASLWMGHRFVPPTVLTTYQNKLGSLQFFVKTQYDLFKRKDKEKVYNRMPQKVKSDARLFYFIFGQTDSHIGNQLISIDKHGKIHVALIDNADIILDSKTKRKKESLQKMTANRKHKHKHYGPSKNSAFKLVYPTHYSKRTLDRYNELSREALHKIFEDALRDRIPYCTRKLFDRILQRKSHILRIGSKKMID